MPRTIISEKTFSRAIVLGLGAALALVTLIEVASVTRAQAANSSTQTVVMKSISFDPKVLTIKAGDSVEWENKSYTEHSATSDSEGVFDTGLTPPNKKTKAVLFSKAGTYPYHCSMHGKAMSAQIVVTQAAGQ